VKEEAMAHWGLLSQIKKMISLQYTGFFIRQENFVFLLNAEPGGSHTFDCPLLIIKYIQTPLPACKGATQPGKNPAETYSETECVILVWVCRTHWGDQMKSVHKAVFGEVEESGVLGRSRCRWEITFK
jgi:hypothetical protein